jgi:hypothetical protein
MTVLSTSETSGTEIFDRIMGAASAHTCRCVARWRQSLKKLDMKAPGQARECSENKHTNPRSMCAPRFTIAKAVL